MDFAATLFGITLCFSAVYGQVITRGYCPNIPVDRDFQLQPFLGVWYEFERFYNDELRDITCVRRDFQPNPSEENTLRVFTRGINTRTCERVQLIGRGEVYDPVNDPASGELTYYRDTVVLPRGNFWVINIDYDNYCVVYSCNDVGQFKVETAYILLRRPVSPSVGLLWSIYRHFLRYGINPEYFIRSDCNACRRRGPTRHIIRR